MQLDGKVKDPVSRPHQGFYVQGGFPNVVLYAKNTGTKSFRVEVRNDNTGKVIFNKTFAKKSSDRFVNNDNNPPVPAGNYTVTVYGGSGLPKGSVVLKSSTERW